MIITNLQWYKHLLKITAGTENNIIAVVTKTDTDKTPLELINNLSPNKQTNKQRHLTDAKDSDNERTTSHAQNVPLLC